MASRRSQYGLDGLNFSTASMQAGFGSFVVVQLVANHWPAEAIGLALTVVRVRASRSSTHENMKQKNAATPIPLAINGTRIYKKKRENE